MDTRIDTPEPRARRRRAVRGIAAAALVGVLAVGLAACGDDDDESGATTTAAEETAVLTLTGEETLLTLDPGTAAVLTENSVSVAPSGDAAATDDGAIAFPITGGEVEAESLAGTIDHSGGLVFSAGGTELEVSDFVIDTTAGQLIATAGGAEVPLLDVDLTELTRSEDGDVLVLEGISTDLTTEGANALNETFGVDLFTDDTAIGTVVVRAQGSE